MKIKKLSLTGMRAFTQAEFNFLPGMNLLVGVNGVGKTTVLDALRICLSRVLPDINAYPSQKQAFEMDDISIGAQTLTVSCDFEIESQSFNLLQVKQRELILENKPGSPRESVIELDDAEKVIPSIKELFSKSKSDNPRHLGLFFSTKRSIVTDKAVSGHATAGGLAAAFSESLSSNRDFNLRLLADWFKVQETLGEERPIGLKHISVLKNAVEQFLPGFNNLRVERIEEKSRFVIDKNGTSLNLYQLSDGERGVLSMVLDIARRLSQANPTLPNPLADGTAIVLIDELDLHLHPKWQRTIVENLTRTFPNCQFIASTHSPQIIPSVDPERIQLIRNGEIIHPDRTKGMDSNWILKFLMESEDRPFESTTAIEKVELLIKKGKFKEARTIIAECKNENRDLDEWSMFEARMSRLEVFSKPI
ncbi:MAG TPA: AAA family ATPase [Prolixibacteraceae bacterium]|nr:AAA family ATPase [Prolixibacteraceae bacterium]